MAPANGALWTMRTTNLHQHAEGAPKLRDNAFYRCPSCMTRKLCIKQPVGKQKRKNTKQQHIQNSPSTPIYEEPFDDVYLPNTLPGQHFHMDFGFVRGSEFK